jgi:hypothetical protein
MLGAIGREKKLQKELRRMNDREEVVRRRNGGVGDRISLFGAPEVDQLFLLR